MEATYFFWIKEYTSIVDCSYLASWYFKDGWIAVSFSFIKVLKK